MSADPSRKVRLVLSPESEKYVRRDAPVDVRRIAARGALPLPPLDLATVLFALLHDPDDVVKTSARESLERLPAGLVSTVLAGPAHPAVLSYVGHLHADDAALMEALALNPAADDATSVWLASLPHRNVVEIVANNQQRVLRCPEIVEALGENPLTGRAVIDRILSFLGVERRGSEESDGAESELPPPDALEPTDSEALAALRALLGDDMSEFSKQLLEEGEALDEEAQTNLLALIQSLSVFHKIKLARNGNKEARAILVRDRNKIVASSAIRSPKITESEVEGFAKARNVCEDVIRIIAMTREWTKSYVVKLNLVMNPRCPQTTSVKFLNYLQEKDLRAIMRSKDVPTAISTHARRLLSKKGKV